MALKKVRVLAAWPLGAVVYQANQVVQVEEAKIKQALKDGVVDAAKAAVDYCVEELGAVVIVHDAMEGAAPPAPPAPPAGGAGGAGDNGGQSGLQV